jgi:membrane protease subunit HflK
MPWNNNGPGPWGTPGGSQGGNQGGGDGGGQPPPKGPWGGGGGGGDDGREPGGNRGGRGNGPFGPNGPLPDIDRLIAQAQAFIRGLLPGGGGFGFGGVWIVFLGIVLVWAASGFYRVQPDEQGIILRFGAYKGWTDPGLHYHLPWPIERVELPAVTRINRTEIGYRSDTSVGRVDPGADTSGRDVTTESLMLTGDENINDVGVAVFWRIRANEANKFLFNASQPADLVRGVAESSVREVIGREPIQPALNQPRAQINADVAKQTQAILDRYNVGIEITDVQLQKVDPPAPVRESFLDVQRANTDQERVRNEAESFHNDIVPRARGDAARILAEAQGVKQATIAEATGQTQRFDAVLAAYRQSKDITLRRMYIDAMQNALSHASTLIVDDKLKGLVPFLPLNVPPSVPVAKPPQPSQTAPAQQGATTR